MANRLTQIATRTGDDGTTGLGDNTRVPKHHQRVQALGAQEAVRETPRHYLNRLSDLMFVLARVCNRMDGSGGDDVYWRSERLARSGD